MLRGNDCGKLLGWESSHGYLVPLQQYLSNRILVKSPPESVLLLPIPIMDLKLYSTRVVELLLPLPVRPLCCPLLSGCQQNVYFHQLHDSRLFPNWASTDDEAAIVAHLRSNQPLKQAVEQVGILFASRHVCTLKPLGQKELPKVENTVRANHIADDIVLQDSQVSDITTNWKVQHYHVDD
jgi:hypothetical protein